MKKLTALLLATVMIFCLSACGIKGRKESAPAGNIKTTGTTQKITTETATTSASTTETTTAMPVTTTTTTTSVSETSNAAENLTEHGRDIEQFRGKKLLAITFDDGPYTPVTTSLLDRLDKYNARVTFFVLGSRLDGSKSYRNTMKRAYEMGNQIGSHTYSHADLTKLSDDELKKDIDKANAAVRNVIGVEPAAVRPPYGATGKKVEAAMQKHIIMWSIDTMDWKYRNAETVCSNIMKNAFDGGIVLLHDLYQTSVDGAVMAMGKLQKQGYAFVTVDELAELRGVAMDTSTKYFQFKP